MDNPVLATDPKAEVGPKNIRRIEKEEGQLYKRNVHYCYQKSRGGEKDTELRNKKKKLVSMVFVFAVICTYVVCDL
jgi:hypothetical protein